MASLLVLLTLVPFVFSFGHVSARNSSGCPAVYDHKTHWCATGENGTQHLCEIVNGVYFDLCGTDQCYTDLQYTCNGITLSEPPKSTGAFYLSVFAPGSQSSYQYIQASGTKFWVGGQASTYCPFDEESGFECPSDEYTIFYDNALAVNVPGGQRIFIQEDGTLAFTVAHSSYEPDEAYDGENVAYVHAGYFGPDGHSWAACKPRGSTERRRIVADLPGFDLRTEDCEGIFLYASGIGEDRLGAWEYT